MSEKEHRVISTLPNHPDVELINTIDSRKAGDKFREAKKKAFSGEKVELQEREIAPWKTVEKYIEGKN